MVENSASSPLAHLLCCADLYQHPLVQAVLGESWHPGGLALTRALAQEVNLGPGDHMLDLACGVGASALMLAQVFKCRVTGIDTNAEAILQARQEARRYRLEIPSSFTRGEGSGQALVDFAQADATSLAFPAATFSAAFCECATSLFGDRRSAFGEMARVLRPGGRLALSDVTFRPESLPDWIDASLAGALCIPVGMGPEKYVQLLGEAGFLVRCSQDYSGAVAQLLDKVESLLGVGRLASIAPALGGGPLGQAEAAICHARQLLRCGDLGYWAFIAEKPQSAAG